MHWESRKHRKRLQQHTEAPHADAAQRRPLKRQGEELPPASLCSRMFPFKPAHIAWWTAVLFDIGSFCFVFSSICEFIPGVYDSLHLDTGFVGWVAFTGSMFFTIGSWLQLGEVVSAPILSTYHTMSKQQWKHAIEKAYKGRPQQPLLDDQQQQQQQQQASGGGQSGSGSQHGSATQDNLSSLLFRLDFHVAWIQLIGAMAFSINTFAFSGSFMLTQPQITGLVDFCDVFASCCFTISGYLSIIECTHSIIPFKKLPLSNSLTSIEWHITWYNFLGGIGFLLNGIFIIYYPDPGQLTPAYPLLLGSLFFQAGTHLQYLEQADKHKKPDEQQPEQQQQRKQQEMNGTAENGHGHSYTNGATMAHQQLAVRQIEEGAGSGSGSSDGVGVVTMNGQYAAGVS